MSTGPLSQCLTCRRLRSPYGRPPGPGKTCEAFPDGIPDAVFFNALDHRRPVEGDHGIRWDSNGRSFPEWALAQPSDSA